MSNRFIRGFFLLMIVFSCQKEEIPPRLFPGIRTLNITDVSIDGATLKGELVKTGNEAILDWGFVWDSVRKPALEKSEFKILKYHPGNKNIFYDIRSTLVPGKTYYARAFVRTGSHIVYGNELSFISRGSKGPEILNFAPQKATNGDTIRLQGKHFSTRAFKNIVTINHIAVDITYISDSLLLVVIPSTLEKKETHISITVAGKTSVAKNLFILTGPKIKDFHPKTGTVGDTVIITGSLFAEKPENNHVKFGSYDALVTEADTNLLKVLVPAGLRQQESFISIGTGEVKNVSDVPFVLTKPVINEIIPGLATVGDTVIIHGKEFSLIPEENHIYINNNSCKILSSAKTELRLIVPDHCQPPPDITHPLHESETYLTVAGVKSDINKDFTYLAPLVNFVTPPTASFTDTMTLRGKNFLFFKKELKLKIDGYDAEIRSVMDEAVTFKIPNGPKNETPDIEISTNHYKSVLTDAFSFLPPQIQNVSPDSATFNDEITVQAMNLNPVKENNSVEINGIDAQITAMTGNTIKAIIPEQVQTTGGNLNLTIYTGEGMLFDRADNALTLKSPVIHGFSPQTVDEIHTPITITGSWFNPDPALNVVTYKQMTLNVLQASGSELIVEVPSDSIYISFDYTDVIRIKCGGLSAMSTDSLRVRYKLMWTRKKDFPGEPITFTACFSLGSKGYLCGGQTVNEKTNELWEYDPVNDEWNRKADFPGGRRTYLTVFTDDGFAYVGMGLADGTGWQNDIWRYDPGSDSWTRVTDFPSISRFPVVFTLNHKAYIGLGDQKRRETGCIDFWEYDILSNSWSQKDSVHYFENHITWHAYSAVLYGKAYSTIYTAKPFLINKNSYRGNSTLMEYDQENDQWTHLGTPMGERGESHTVINDRWYHLGRNFVRYDPASETKWTYLPKPVDSLLGAFMFTINGKGYYGMGQLRGSPIVVPTIWEIDPSQYP